MWKAAFVWPTLYSACIAFMLLDVSLIITGNGEANLGAWMFFVTTFGAGPRYAVLIWVTQLILLYFIGGKIDAINARSTKQERPDPRAAEGEGNDTSGW